MELKTYLAIIVRRLWVVLLITLLIGGASVYASKWLPQQYQAETSLRVTTPIIGSVGDISYQTYYADRLMNTYAQIAASEQVMEEVKTTLNLEKLPDISVKTIPNSEIIQISVTDSDPVLAAKTANTLTSILISRSQESVEKNSLGLGDRQILAERQKMLQTEMEQARVDHKKLIEEYATTSSQLAVLDRKIQMKETFYQSLLNQRQKAIVDEAVSMYRATTVPAATTKNLLTENIDQIEAELATMNRQYQDLSARSAKYSEELSIAGRIVEEKEMAYLDLLSQMDAARIAESKQVSAQDLAVASPAIVPSLPSGPTRALIISLGVLLGLIGGILLAFVLDSLDTRIFKDDQVRQLSDSPILGHLPRLNRADSQYPFESRAENVQSAYWTLCTKLLILQQNKEVKSIVVTSPNPREGKSTVVLSIATGLARANRKVLVVDADLRSPKLHKRLNVLNEQGLSSFLRGENSLEDVIQTIEKPGIHFLPAGPALDDPVDLFHTALFARLMDQLAAYDVVLFDSPALLAVPDAYELAVHMDVTLLILQWKHTTVEDARSAISLLNDVNNKFLGIILNHVPGKRASSYYRHAARLRRPSEPSAVQSH